MSVHVEETFGNNVRIILEMSDLIDHFHNLPVTINNTFKLRSSFKFSYICCIFAPLASTQSFCLWSLERITNLVCGLEHHELYLLAEGLFGKRMRAHDPPG